MFGRYFGRYFADIYFPPGIAVIVAPPEEPPVQPLPVYLSPGRLYTRPPELVIVHHGRAHRVVARCILTATATVERAPEAVAARAQACVVGRPEAERVANLRSVVISAWSHGTAYRETRLGHHRRLLARS